SSPFTANPVGAGKRSISKVQLVDLKKLDPANPMRDWEEGQRRRVRVAHRNGVTVRKAETSTDWERYYSLYELSLQRWGKRATIAYPRSLFENIRDALSGQPAMTLWLAEHNGQIGAGYLTFYHNRHVVPCHGAGLRRFRPHGQRRAFRRRGFQKPVRRPHRGISLLAKPAGNTRPGGRIPGWIDADFSGRETGSTLRPHEFPPRK